MRISRLKKMTLILGALLCFGPKVFAAAASCDKPFTAKVIRLEDDDQTYFRAFLDVNDKDGKPMEISGNQAILTAAFTQGLIIEVSYYDSYGCRQSISIKK